MQLHAEVQYVRVGTTYWRWTSGWLHGNNNQVVVVVSATKHSFLPTPLLYYNKFPFSVQDIQLACLL